MLIILSVLVGYVVLAYALDYKDYSMHKGCGLDTLAFLCAPLLLPLKVKDAVQGFYRRLFK